ncbi:lipase/esterase [Paracoccidioides lutzii Pb01]|uniref:Lipase/esterase n=1 Tax=Paracoccidioides lutzii (strain ATCC MYA-826 / Pb01) TaxID=502779 RepID=C1H0J9_PARBA|nr:lipase/esterase [Paracoccidioides lutzii Pb01]EEH33240.1 lipase/esterase [Paracoccidioides lutzii Pb01]
MAADAEPKSKYAHFAEPHLVFETFKEEASKPIDAIYAIKDMDTFKAAWNAFPPVVFDDGPVVGQDITIEHINIPVSDGTLVELRIYKPINPVPTSTLFFVSHGGGWTICTHDVEEAQNRQVAKDNKCVVVSVEYRKCPEFPFPYPLNDCYDALLWCKSNASTLGINPEKIILAGTSGGGNLAACIALKARDEGVTGIIGQVLNMPMICHPDLFPRDKYEYKSWEENENEAVASSSRALFHWNLYLPELKPDAYANPILAESHANLPPALIQVAGLDPLRDEAFAYGEALKAAGVPATVKGFVGLPHAFYFFLQQLNKESREYIQNIVDFVQDVEKKSIPI